MLIVKVNKKIALFLLFVCCHQLYLCAYVMYLLVSHFDTYPVQNITFGVVQNHLTE